MSYDNIISRGDAQARMKPDVMGGGAKKRTAGPSGKGLAGPAKTHGKPASHPPTKLGK